MLGYNPSMARSISKLSAAFVSGKPPEGRHSDGGGLYLLVDAGGAKRWLFIFRFDGKQKEMGLGGVQSVRLARARELAVEARALVADGKNPIQERRALRVVPTFGETADALVADLSPQWRNPKHKAQWAMTLTHYAEPLRARPVDQITTEEVFRVLKPLWETKPETASRLRGRMERVLDAAKVKGFRSGENPARWRGHLDHLLPRRQKLSRGHHAALPYADLPAFMAELRARKAIAARALEFTILTAARSGEVRGAHWPELDLTTRIWAVPAERMKAGREHRVPLCSRAVAILEDMKKLRVGDYVFPGGKATKGLSDGGMERVLDRMSRPVTVHGFRSTFRDWVSEETEHPREIAEAALAHIFGDSTERAYRRGDALEKRRRLMEDWAQYLS